MELHHLYSFLDSPDDDTSDLPHRSIDEILNDCHSSSSSSPSPPSSPHSLEDSPLTLNSHHPDTHKPVHSIPGSFPRPDDPYRSRPFSSLFAGVRSNAKPGAALAAAAAASRPVPTPHAAAMRRAGSGSLQKVASSVAGSVESTSITGGGGGDSDDVSSSKGEFGESSDKLSGSQSSSVDNFNDVPTRVETFHNNSKVDGAELATEVNGSISKANNNGDSEVQNDSSLVSQEKSDLDQHLETTPSLDEDEHDSVKNMNYAPFTDVEKPSVTNLDIGDKGVSEDGLMIEAMETEELVNGSSCVEDSNNEVNVGDNDDGSSITHDVSELVENKLEELERKRDTRRGDKILKFSKKPLELAEDLEKKHASTGFHLEEGAAAQPMRLEGVRRGSTTLGYVDANADNAVTRAISSQAFRREHGSAQVLAVHANYIAVGMTKGLIVVVPSKYSIYHADNTDGKVVSLSNNLLKLAQVQ